MSSTILRNIQIVDPKSEFHGKQTDIFIQDGVIVSMQPGLQTSADTEVNLSGAVATTGWVDVLAHCGEPGEEWKEDFKSLSAAAHAGGFTHVAVLAGGHPKPDHAATIAAISAATAGLPIHVLPLGHATAGANGSDLAELFDMQKSGVIAFTDGDDPIADTGVIARLMEYGSGLRAPILYFPYDKKLASGGRMHEGIISTSLGLKGIPAISESAALEQILQIAGWLKVPVSIIRVSSTESVEIIRRAKSMGVEVRAAVPVYNLLFTDEDLTTFDENHKVLPPYRTEKDKLTLWQGISDGAIDAVMSNHHPEDIESKAVEFEYAAWGASSIQTVLSAMLGGGKPDLTTIASSLSEGPRKLLGLPKVSLNPGQPADITVFSPTAEWVFEPQLNFSKGVNHPLQGKTLKGMVLGTVKSGTWLANPAAKKHA